jgi:hypothetical protein
LSARGRAAEEAQALASAAPAAAPSMMHPGLLSLLPLFGGVSCCAAEASDPPVIASGGGGPWTQACNTSVACPADQTCCRMSSGNFGCCPGANATCCPGAIRGFGCIFWFCLTWAGWHRLRSQPHIISCVTRNNNNTSCAPRRCDVLPVRLRVFIERQAWCGSESIDWLQAACAHEQHRQRRHRSQQQPKAGRCARSATALVPWYLPLTQRV